MTTAARSARTTGVRGARSAITGAVGGTFRGLTGVSAGAVVVPLLTRQLQLSQHCAHATSLAIVCFIAASGVIGYRRAGWANRLDGDVLKRVCGVVAMGLGLQMLCSVLRQPRESAALQAG